MDIIVCIKQVPGTNKVEVDEKTGVLKRSGVDSKMNPYDQFAIETALRIVAERGGVIRVITMGPPQSEAVIREAFALGADEGYLLTDRAFAGADVLATSYALAQGIRMTGHYDLIICGKQTTDGDTAQVGAEISQWLGISAILNVSKIENVFEDKMRVAMEVSDALSVSDIPFPCLISVEKDIYTPRLPSYVKKRDTLSREIKRITLKDLSDSDATHYGLDGSATRVERIFPPSVKTDRELWRGDGVELADKAYDKMRSLKLV